MLTSPLLGQYAQYIDGQWLTANGETLAVLNPATGDQLASIPKAGEAEATAAVVAAERAMQTPAPFETRRGWLNAIADAIEAHREELGRIITLEQGKPLREGIGEAVYAAAFYRDAAKQIDCLRDEIRDEQVRGCTWTVRHTPAGVAGLITPWNFPLAMLAKKLSAALAAGCATVTKPAPETPLTAIAFFTLLDRLNLPAGMANLVIGHAEPIGQVLCTHPAVRILSFTGSTDVGKLLSTQAAPHIKRLALELGGNAPLLVFEDADLDAAADELVANKFRAGGQTCVCTNRIYVQEEVADAFTQRIIERVRKLTVGDGTEPATDIGPLIDQAGFDKVAAHVQDALAKGAQRLVGSTPDRPTYDWAAYYPPTVLTGVTQDMLLTQEETFGPVVAIGTFTDEAEAITLANDTPYGLAAYLFTQDAARAERITPQLRFGHVGLNTATGPCPQTPFGGMKHSGLGREGGMEGLLEFCETQVVARR